MQCVTRIRRNLDGSIAGCVLSECGAYRYALWRIWNQAKPFWMWILLNPSKATEELDDPTIARCVVRAQRGGAGGLVVVNAGAIRETDAGKACRAADPIGPANSDWIRALAPACQLHIAGWGPLASRFGGDRLAVALFRGLGLPLHALKLNKDGSPAHPLYLSYDREPFPI